MTKSAEKAKKVKHIQTKSNKW